MRSNHKYYDRDGVPISEVKWSELFSNKDYRTVARTMFPGTDFVSTIWMGLDHRFGEGPILIFETMSYENEEWVEQVRYSTLEEAKEGHDEVLKRVEERRAILQHPFGRLIEA